MSASILLNFFSILYFIKSHFSANIVDISSLFPSMTYVLFLFSSISRDFRAPEREANTDISHFLDDFEAKLDENEQKIA